MVERRHRVRVVIRGAVQGVGFRPFVYNLARSLALYGWVINTSQGVIIEAEGTNEDLQRFLSTVRSNPPRQASIHSLESIFLDPVGFSEFKIRDSIQSEKTTAVILPDIATCDDCLQEILDPSNRRYRYPFTNCTNCGPRYSILEALPYDRAQTSMKHFTMCSECQAEYDDPTNRRYHAQPNACPKCGPQLWLKDPQGANLAEATSALDSAVQAILEGKILALQGLGGYQLIADATNSMALQRLRERKHRVEKPFAVLFPSLDWIGRFCHLQEAERMVITSPEAPICLVKRKNPDGDIRLADEVAPKAPYLGVMLPYTPLHHLLLQALNLPVVATSGNRSNDPICISEAQALQNLGDIADFFLSHNRRIQRQVDDSVVRVQLGRELILRRARGYAPLPFLIPDSFDAPLIAAGGQQKNTIALAIENQVFVSQHIGDLESNDSFVAFRSIIRSLPELYRVTPADIIHDPHPGYLSTQYAAESGSKTFAVQHHIAHISACMAENQLVPPLLGIAWDGTGFGEDNTIWGGESFLIHTKGYQRLKYFLPFPLLGGAAAVREPQRVGVALLEKSIGEIELLGSVGSLPFSLQSGPLRSLLTMGKKGINSPLTSSAGRLFDGVAAILGLRNFSNYEGQAAIDLEFLATSCEIPFEDLLPYTVVIDPQIDWRLMVKEIFENEPTETPQVQAARFHKTMVEVLVQIAKHSGETKVALSGGCFQNRLLVEWADHRLKEEGFAPYWHQRIPPNDGGIALGQIYAKSLGLTYSSKAK